MSVPASQLPTHQRIAGRLYGEMYCDECGIDLFTNPETRISYIPPFSTGGPMMVRFQCDCRSWTMEVPEEELDQAARVLYGGRPVRP